VNRRLGRKLTLLTLANVTRRPLAFDPIDEARVQWDGRWSSLASDQMAAATSIMRAQQLVLAAVDDALKPLQLTFARCEVLLLLAFSREGMLPLGKIGPRLMIHQASVTSLIDRLEIQGLVQRVPHPKDGRTTLAKITLEGRRLAMEGSKAVNEISFGLDMLDEKELGELVSLVRKMRIANGDYEE
jgi:DNA-binding MarR family transcriptional regulator